MPSWDRISEEDYKRARYVIGEEKRVLDVCEALEKGDYETVGARMYETHWGMSKDYEVSCEELDFLATLAGECGVTGARIMGGGFGGDVPDELCYQWAREYFRDAEAKEDAEPEEKFVPKTYNGKMPKAGKVKKDKPKKAAPKPAPKPANEEQLTFGDFGTEEAAG